MAFISGNIDIINSIYFAQGKHIRLLVYKWYHKYYAYDTEFKFTFCKVLRDFPGKDNNPVFEYISSK